MNFLNVNGQWYGASAIVPPNQTCKGEVDDNSSSKFPGRPAVRIVRPYSGLVFGVGVSTPAARGRPAKRSTIVRTSSYRVVETSR